MRSANSAHRRLAALALSTTLAALSCGCAGPGPVLFPPMPLEVRTLDDGGRDRLYDTNRDGLADYVERLGPAGTVVLLRYDTDGDETFDTDIVPGDVGDANTDAAAPGSLCHLIVLLDSIPFDMVYDLWDQGRFRLFPEPSRVVSPFPVMTDLSFAELFGVSPCPGAEASYYDGERLSDALDTYLRAANAPWVACVDYRLRQAAHGFAYTWPEPWYDHELGRIQRAFDEQRPRRFVGYVVGTSALGAKLGRNGHQAALVRLDRFCQEVVHRMRGQVSITLLSDHGHNLVRSRRIPLDHILRRFGYRLRKTLQQPEDVVLGQWGVVTYAGIYTRAAAAVARDLLGVEGVDLTMFRNGHDEIVVRSRSGAARISHRAGAYRYQVDRGDPLSLRPTLNDLRARGAVDDDGFVDDRELFAATTTHRYPDAVHRIWRAFHGLIENTPDVLVSVKDGWHCGSAGMSKWIDLAAAHGNLAPPSTYGFVMTTAGVLPPVVRMEALADALTRLGVPVRCAPAADATGGSASVAVGALAPAPGSGEVQ